MPPVSIHTLRRGGRLAACALLLLAACTTAPRSAGSARLALVIGNAAYENVTALVNPVNDAADMCAALRRLGFKTLCHTNLRDHAEFAARVKDYIDQLGPESVGVVYYAGHGVQAANANFLIPTRMQLEAALANPLQELYGVNELFDSLRQRPSTLQIVILDACRTDLFDAAAAGRGPQAAPRPGLARALQTVGGARYGMAEITTAPRATKVFYATASKEAASDGRGRNGALTKYILRHIGTPGLELDPFFNLVTRGVEDETRRDFGSPQSPFVYGSFTGRFCFAGCNINSPVPAVN